MGGSGSGRWRGSSKKMTTADSLVLRISDLGQAGLLSGQCCSATITWNSDREGADVASVDLRVECSVDNQILIHLSYPVEINGRPQEIDEAVHLSRAPQQFGGDRWWFSCPIEVGGKECNRRAGTLHLPPGELYFGCRHCHLLTYESCQCAP